MQDLKRLLTQAGGEGKETVFLFNDTQIKDPAFLEDINNILNTGEVPNLYPADEKAVLLEMLRRPAKEAGLAATDPNTLFSFFVQRCRNLLHVVLAMSPIGDAFRERLRMFPSLVNCCTVDWFSEWPSDALQAVAEEFLTDLGHSHTC